MQVQLPIAGVLARGHNWSSQSQLELTVLVLVPHIPSNLSQQQAQESLNDGTVNTMLVSTLSSHAALMADQSQPAPGNTQHQLKTFTQRHKDQKLPCYALGI